MSDNKNTFTIGATVAPVLSGMTRTINHTGDENDPGVDYTFDCASAPDAAFTYVLQYGFSQAMADTQAIGAAGLVSAAVKADILTKEQVKPLGKKPSKESLETFLSALPDGGAAFNAWAAHTLAKRAVDRLSDILSGDMVFGVAERLTPEEKDRRELTMNSLKAAMVANNAKMPKDAEAVNELLTYVYEEEKATIDAEVNRRAKARARGPSANLGAGLAAKLAALAG